MNEKLTDQIWSILKWGEASGKPVKETHRAIMEAIEADREAGVPCPCCLQPQHSFESMQLHYKAHTETEKRGAWEKTLQERRHVFALVPVGEGDK